MTAQQIINDVARHCGITPDQLVHGDRQRVYTDPRHIAAYCLHVGLGLEYSAIGRMLGGKCHGTIIYAVDKVAAWMRLPQLNPDAVHFINALLTQPERRCDNEEVA